MQFDLTRYSEEVRSILALDGSGERLMPLAQGSCSSEEARLRLEASAASTLFPGARSPESALCGLYLYFSCRDEAHHLAQDISTAEGSFWHGIVHRQEPDAGNAAYWFRQVGTHATFTALASAAAELGVNFGSPWDPFKFIDFCEKFRNRPESREAQSARAVQLVEWQLLFAYCASPKASKNDK